jgi:hypothetical protein
MSFPKSIDIKMSFPDQPPPESSSVIVPIKKPQIQGAFRWIMNEVGKQRPNMVMTAASGVIGQYLGGWLEKLAGTMFIRVQITAGEINFPVYLKVEGEKA